MDTGRKVMDTGERLTQISSDRANQIQNALEVNSGVFQVGEILIIKGSMFRIQSMGRNRMKLRLLHRG
jgi:hypothetical protein